MKTVNLAHLDPPGDLRVRRQDTSVGPSSAMPANGGRRAGNSGLAVPELGRPGATRSERGSGKGVAHEPICRQFEGKTAAHCWMSPSDAHPNSAVGRIFAWTIREFLKARRLVELSSAAR